MKKMCRGLATTVLIATSFPALARGVPERIDGWIITPDPPTPHSGCSMTARDARSRLLIMLAENNLRIEASSRIWLSSGSIDRPVQLTFDGDVPTALSAQNAGPDGISLSIDTKLSASSLVERLKTAKVLWIRKENDAGAKTVSFGVTGFGPAYARLQDCAAGAEARAAESISTRHARCESVVAAATAVLGGRRSADSSVDHITIEATGIRLLVDCGIPDGPVSLTLSGETRGVSAATLSTTGKLAAVMAGHSDTLLTALPATCLTRVRRYEIHRGGKRTHFPEGAVAMFEGEAEAPPIKLTCRYYDAVKVQPSFIIEMR